MKNCLLIILTVLSINTANSQYVTISDPGFLDYLQTNHSNCMNGNQMDTTCASILNITTFDNNQLSTQLQDYFGINYFDNLTYLDLSSSQIDSIYDLPSNLEILYLTQSTVEYIDEFPQNLRVLGIENTNLTTIPNLPNTLEIYLSDLNPNLAIPIFPLDIKRISLSYCNLTLASFPIFNAGLENLNISGNSIGQLPILPNSITKLVCNACDLTVFSTPPNIRWLEASNNSFQHLTNLPDTMNYIIVNNSGLLTIDNFPSETDNLVSIIEISNNQLTRLPTLPNNLTQLIANDNQLVCLPNLPNSLLQVNLENNQFTCVPNVISISSNYPCLDTLPICSILYTCPESALMSGSIVNDMNSNCQIDVVDVNSGSIPVRMYDENNQLVSTINSGTGGNYFFNTQIYASNRIEIDTINKPYAVLCNYPGVDSIFSVLNYIDSTIDNVNFIIGCKPSFDIGTQAVINELAVFPGQNHYIKCLVGDLSNSNNLNLNCADGIGGTVTITITGLVSYVEPINGALTPTFINGNIFTYQITNFSAVDIENDFGLVLSVDTIATLGDEICVNIVTTPNLGESNDFNNDYTFCYDVVNSYDPNDKTVYPKSVEPLYNDWLIYTIRFQNTGNAPAYNIKLKDSISDLLDYSTFEMINYSHTNSFSLEGDILTVNYPNIMLVDSTTNFDESIGYFQYRIKPIENLQLGTEIENKAYIYFDYNTPIITNTAITKFNEEPSNNSLKTINKKNIDVTLFPNPSTGDVTIVLGDFMEQVSLKLYALDGKLIKAEDFENKKSINWNLNCEVGIYYIKVEYGNQQSVLKVFVE